jgi:hypothetical protein
MHSCSRKLLSSYPKKCSNRKLNKTTQKNTKNKNLKLKNNSPNINLKTINKKHPIPSKAETHSFPFAKLKSKWKNLLFKENKWNNCSLIGDSNIYAHRTAP